MSVRRIVKTIMTVSLMIIMFPISGCLGNATPGPTQEGPVVIRVQIPDMFRPKAKALSSFDSAVTELLFTLSKGGVTVSRSVASQFRGGCRDLREPCSRTMANQCSWQELGRTCSVRG